ncbi:hypothetical protein D3C74_460960 [compost metagenome]
MRLDVGEVRAEQFLDALDGQGLDDVDFFAAAVVAAARVAFGVLVGQHRALGLHDGLGGVVLRGDHFQAALLAGQFSVDALRHLRVKCGEVFGQ